MQQQLSRSVRNCTGSSSQCGPQTHSAAHVLQQGSTLVIYVYQNTEDEDQQANWQYFLRMGMAADDGNVYHIVAQELVRLSSASNAAVA